MIFYGLILRFVLNQSKNFMKYYQLKRVISWKMVFLSILSEINHLSPRRTDIQYKVYAGRLSLGTFDLQMAD